MNGNGTRASGAGFELRTSTLTHESLTADVQPIGPLRAGIARVTAVLCTLPDTGTSVLCVYHMIIQLVILIDLYYNAVLIKLMYIQYQVSVPGML